LTARIDPRNTDDWIPRDVFAEYCGPDSPELLAYYDKARRKRNQLTWSFDLLAFLAFPAWLGYRRQWTVWTTLVVLIGALPFVENLAGFETPLGAFAGIGIAFGFMARGLLLASANAAYLRRRARGCDEATIRQALRGKANKSIPLAFAGGLGAVAVVIALGAVADTLA
jgi:hypothetical protein